MKKHTSIRRPFTLLTLVATSLELLAGCDTWEGLRDEARALRAEAETCDAGDTCEVVWISNDCTGALGCPFAVRSEQRAYVIDKGTELAERSRQTNTCAMADCAEPGEPRCDAELRRCVLDRPR